MAKHVISILVRQQVQERRRVAELSGQEFQHFAPSWDPRWSEVLKLLAGQLRDPSPFLNLLADENTDDMFRHRLALAATCLPEISLGTRKLRSDAVNQVAKAAFL